MNAIDFNKGKLYINGECICIEELEWNEHPVFKGVFIVVEGEAGC